MVFVSLVFFPIVQAFGDPRAYLKSQRAKKRAEEVRKAKELNLCTTAKLKRPKTNFLLKISMWFKLEWKYYSKSFPINGHTLYLDKKWSSYDRWKQGMYGSPRSWSLPQPGFNRPRPGPIPTATGLFRPFVSHVWSRPRPFHPIRGGFRGRDIFYPGRDFATGSFCISAQLCLHGCDPLPRPRRPIVRFFNFDGFPYVLRFIIDFS